MCFTPKDITDNIVLPLWNEKSLEIVDSFFMPQADIRTTFTSGTGPQILKKSIQDTFVAFPDFEIKVDDIIQQENKVTYKWRAKGKHEGTILGIPGSGQETHFSGMVFGEFMDDKICVYHSFSNIPQVLRSLCENYQAQQKGTDQSDLSSLLRRITEIPLTKREIECLSRWVQGCSIKESAKQMGGLSERTVQTYRENIKQKFRAKNFQKLLSTIQESGVMPVLLGASI